MPLQETSGTASYDAFGGGVAAVPNYIEDVFSTWLYTGNGSTQTITNGINLSGKGGLVWMKARNGGSIPNYLIDTSAYLVLNSNNTNAGGSGYYPTYFNPTSSGFFIDESAGWFVNTASTNFASWTFRKQPKFFDVVTYTGDGTSSRNISHSLGSTPGCIIVKRTDSTSDWFVSHVGYNSGLAYTGVLNSTAAFASGTQVQVFYSNSTTFRVGTGANDSGATYVAYLFAHNAGGFGLTGTDNVISCGSYTGNGSATGPIVTLGYEPQWVLIKNASASADWVITDNMRGWTVAGQVDGQLFPNSSGAETSVSRLYPTATGFGIDSTSLNYNTNGSTYIYIAIRRGPMKTPTSGTSVFSALKGASTNPGFITGWPVDALITGYSPGYTGYPIWGSRLTADQVLTSSATDAQTTNAYYKWDYSNGSLNLAVGSDYVGWNFRRAPGFFDVVCYTGTGAATTVAHNLGVAPELMIVKSRSGTTAWTIYNSTLGNNASLAFSTGAVNTPATQWNTTSPTSTVFSIGTSAAVNGSGSTYVAYLFASCPGVSKVGSYTGNGSTQTINCGFTGGARFVLIKRTDSTGDWYVYDTARGMTTLTDPYLLLNSTAAESATLGSVTTVSTGFAVNASILAAINTNAASYIFLAIA